MVDRFSARRATIVGGRYRKSDPFHRLTSVADGAAAYFRAFPDSGRRARRL